jgi:hypothetical protein
MALNPGALWACAACAGQSDSAMAKGMNWGIMSLLVVVAMVLGGVTSFFVFLAKRSATVSANSVSANPQSGRASVPANPDSRGFPERLGLARTLALPGNPDPLLGATDPIL